MANAFQRIGKPFGDEEDANQAVYSVLSTVERLSVQSRRVVGKVFRDANAEYKHQRYLLDLREVIASRARAVHVDPAEFLNKAQAELERRLGRKMPIPPLASVAQVADTELQRLQIAVDDANIVDAKCLAALTRARTRFLQAREALEKAQRTLDEYSAGRKAA